MTMREIPNFEGIASQSDINKAQSQNKESQAEYEIAERTVNLVANKQARLFKTATQEIYARVLDRDEMIKELLKGYKNSINEQIDSLDEERKETLLNSFKELVDEFNENNDISNSALKAGIKKLQENSVKKDSEFLKRVTDIANAYDNSEVIKLIRDAQDFELKSKGGKYSVIADKLSGKSDKNLNILEKSYALESAQSVSNTATLSQQILRNLNAEGEEVADAITRLAESNENSDDIMREVLEQLRETHKITEEQKEYAEYQYEQAKRSDLTSVADKIADKKTKDLAEKSQAQILDKLDELTQRNSFIDELNNSSGFEDIGKTISDRLFNKNNDSGSGSIASDLSDLADTIFNREGGNKSPKGPTPKGGGKSKIAKIGSKIFGGISKVAPKALNLAKVAGPAGAVLSIGLAGKSAYDSWNNAGNLLGTEDPTLSDKFKAASAGIASSLSLGFFSDKEILDFFGVKPSTKDPNKEELKEAKNAQTELKGNAPSIQSDATMEDNNPIKKVLDTGPGYNVVLRPDGSVDRQKGDRNWRNNNPGNIEYGKYTKSKGAIASDGRFAIFPTYDMGRKAKEDLIFEGKNYRDLSLPQAIARYAPPGENNTAAYIRNVSSVVDTIKLMHAYNSQERNAIMDAMQKQEGFRVGKTEQIRAPGENQDIVLDEITNGVKTYDIGTADLGNKKSKYGNVDYNPDNVKSVEYTGGRTALDDMFNSSKPDREADIAYELERYNKSGNSSPVSTEIESKPVEVNSDYDITKLAEKKQVNQSYDITELVKDKKTQPVNNITNVINNYNKDSGFDSSMLAFNTF